jgi:hypothetical protein
MTFATALNCIDGRIQIPVTEYLKRNYGVDYVDMITEPGINRLLSGNQEDHAVAAVRKKTEISSLRHGSRLVAVVGHDDCAGNSADADMRRAQTLSAMETVRGWNFGMRVLGLWVDGNGEVREIE